MFKVEVTHRELGEKKTLVREFTHIEDAKDKARTWAEMPGVMCVKVSQIEECTILEIDGPST